MLPIWLESTVFFLFHALPLSLSAFIGFYFPALLMMPIVYEEEQQPRDIALLRVFVCMRLRRRLFVSILGGGVGKKTYSHDMDINRFRGCN